jgi:hypothetical protein
MKQIPTRPMAQYQRLMDAFCDDLMARDYDTPRTKAVVEIARQINPREPGHGNMPGSDNGNEAEA